MVQNTEFEMDRLAAANQPSNHMIVVFAGALLKPAKTGRVPGILNVSPLDEWTGHRPKSFRRSTSAFLVLATVLRSATGVRRPSSNWAWYSRIFLTITLRS